MVGKMLTNANKGTYLVQKWPKIANVIYERPLRVECLPSNQNRVPILSEEDKNLSEKKSNMENFDFCVTF